MCVCWGGGEGGPSCALSRVSLLEDRHGQTQNSRVQEAGGDGVGRLRPAVGRLSSVVVAFGASSAMKFWYSGPFFNFASNLWTADGRRGGRYGDGALFELCLRNCVEI